MQQVTPTSQWQQNILSIPVGTSLAVRRPLNKPHVVSVTDEAANYMVSQGFAVYCDHQGIPLNNVQAAPESIRATLNERGAEVGKITPETPPETTSQSDETESAPEVVKVATTEEKAIAFLVATPPSEVAEKVKWIGEEKAEELATEENLTWQKVGDLLSARQVKSLVKHVSSME